MLEEIITFRLRQKVATYLKNIYKNDELELDVIDYIRYVCFLKDVPNEYFTLYAILMRCNTNSRIWMKMGTREDICMQVEIPMVTFNYQLKRLVDSGLLWKVRHNNYALNVSYLGRGNWQDVIGVVMRVEFGEEGKMTFKRVFKPGTVTPKELRGPLTKHDLENRIVERDNIPEIEEWEEDDN